MTREATVTKKTLETAVTLRLVLDGTGRAAVTTGVGFFDHLLASLAHHALFDLDVVTTGDLDVDDHHTVEDTALVLGQALADALGDRCGIWRFASASVPMDESLATAAIDVGGRPYAMIDLPFLGQMVGNLSTQNVAHALESFTGSAGVTLHVTATGNNDHHIAEAAFKAVAVALRRAVEIDPRRIGVPSTKGST